MSDKEKIKWQGRTGGGNLGQRLLITLLRVVPIRLIYCVSAATVPFYIIFAYSRYRAIYRYFREQWRLSPCGAFCRAYRNHVIFSQIVVDRFAVFAGKKDIFDTEIEGYDIFDELNRHSKGFVMVSSHIGNYEITGYVLKPDKKRINSLVFASETALVAQNRLAIMGDNNINIVPVADDMSHIFTVSHALQDGQIVSAVADRINGSDKHIKCRLLQGEALFPAGIFTLAATFEVEVVAVFTLKVSPTKYRTLIRRLEIDSPADGTALSKSRRASLLVEAYAMEMEKVLAQYPEQWFNFYDFWQ